MDLNGDGHDDVISGTYWPGDLYVFWGKGKGEYEKGVPLKDADGDNLNAGPKWKNPDKPEMDSLASSPFAFDEDGDGDLDLIVGNISGRVILIPNEGTAKKPAFDTKRRRALEEDGTPIKVPGGDAGPVAADWDQDGKTDLLVGTGDGSVYFFRNGEGKYAKGKALLGPSNVGYQNPAAGAPERPGTRTKLCVTDWNDDGRPDLLVGDFWYEKAREIKLTPEDVKRRDALRERRKELGAKWGELYKKFKKFDGQDPEVKKVQEELASVNRELAALEPRAQTRGSVWLFLRSAKASNGK